MSALTKSLERIDNWFQTNNSRYAKEIAKNSLTKGLTRQQIDDGVKDFPFLLPEEIYELYQWHDGSLELGYFSEVVSCCNLAGSLGQVYPTMSPLIYAPYFPFILADEYAAYVVKGEKYRQEYSPVYYYDKGSGGGVGKIVSPNITNIMEAIAECLETYGFISASQASFNDEEYISAIYEKIDDGKIAEELHNRLYHEKYKPLFDNIYSKYGIKDIWF